MKRRWYNFVVIVSMDITRVIASSQAPESASVFAEERYRAKCPYRPPVKIYADPAGFEWGISEQRSCLSLSLLLVLL